MGKSTVLTFVYPIDGCRDMSTSAHIGLLWLPLAMDCTTGRWVAKMGWGSFHMDGMDSYNAWIDHHYDEQSYT